MKKYITGLLIFVLTIQLSLPALAQNNINQKKQALTECFESLFQNAFSATSEHNQASNEIAYTSDQRLVIVKALTAGMMLNVLDDQHLATAGLMMSPFLLGLMFVGGLAHWSSLEVKSWKALSNYNELAESFKFVETRSSFKISEIIFKFGQKPAAVLEKELYPYESLLNRYSITMKNIQNELSSYEKSMRSLRAPIIAGAIILLVFTTSFYSYGESLSKNYSPISYRDLLSSNSMADFDNQLFVPGNPSSNEISSKLLKTCQSMISNPQNLNARMKDLENASLEDIQKAMDIIEQNSEFH